MKRLCLALILVLSLQMPAFSADKKGADTVELRDGKVYTGAVLFWSGSQLYFHSDEKGLLILSTYDIEKIKKGPQLLHQRPEETPANPAVTTQ